MKAEMATLTPKHAAAGKLMQHTAHGLHRYCFQPRTSGLRDAGVRLRAGYRWGAGTSGRRLREGLLDNVDPAAPADPLEAGWRPLATPVADEPAPSTPTNGSSAAAGDEDSAWRAASQYGASTSGTAGPAAGAADTDNRSSSSSNSSSNGSGAADDDTGWGASLGPVPEDWGWAPSSRNGNGHHHGSTWAGLAGAVGSSTPRDDGSSEAVPGSSSGAWPPDAEDVAGELGSEEGVPDIVELRPQELAAILPTVPRGDQIVYCAGDSAILWQRLGWSLLATLLTLKAAALAAGSFTFPLWFPSIQAGVRNRRARGRFRHVGLWRTAVLGVEVEDFGAPRFRDLKRAAPGPQERLLRLLVGNDSGARSEVTVPYKSQYDVIRRGEPAELLVLSNSRAFASFKVLKEVYLPECGVWVADYPFVDRGPFLDLSLEIEREQQQERQTQGSFS